MFCCEKKTTPKTFFNKPVVLLIFCGKKGANKLVSTYVSLAPQLHPRTCDVVKSQDLTTAKALLR